MSVYLYIQKGTPQKLISSAWLKEARVVHIQDKKLEGSGLPAPHPVIISTRGALTVSLSYG